jgi:uncharacterized membrane protein YdbT with pleckstrin-like domain
MTTLYPKPNNSEPEPKSDKPVDVRSTPHSMRHLAAYAVRPESVRFETQEAEETVELFLRQHPIVNASWIVLSIIIFFSPIVFFPLFSKLFPLPFVIPASYIFIVMIFWYLALYGFILSNFLHWFFNIYIVTNERVVDIDFMFFLYKHFSEAELPKIQDISFTASGMLATIFDYGNVLIETAGELPNIEFEKVPHPEKIVEKIRSLIEHVEQKPL